MRKRKTVNPPTRPCQSCATARADVVGFIWKCGECGRTGGDIPVYEKALASFAALWGEIEDMPGSRQGEVIVHGDGSVTENRWSFSDSGSHRDGEDRNGLRAEHGRAAREDGHRPTSRTITQDTGEA